MRYEDLEKLAKEGKLILTKNLYREKTRVQYIWSEGKDIEIIGKKIIPYRIFHYEARTLDMPEGQFYKLTKKDFITLQELLNQPPSSLV